MTIIVAAEGARQKGSQGAKEILTKAISQASLETSNEETKEDYKQRVYMKSLTDMSLVVADLLKQRGETVAVAETSTGGLISSALLAVAGASAYYKGGSVIYTLESRKQLLGINRSHVEGLEPMTEAMALRFAEVARAQLKATWSIAELGIAGPTGAPYGVDAGTSVIGIDGPQPMTITIATGSNDREENMWAFSAAAFQLFGRALKSP